MSKPPQQYGKHFDVEDTFGGILDGAAKLALWGGLLCLAIGVGFLLVTYSAFGGTQPPTNTAQALSNIGILQKLVLVGGIAAVVGTSYAFWGEETLGVFQLAASAALFFAPFYVPSLLGGGYGGSPHQVAATALAAIQLGGTVMGGLSLIVLVIDIANRVRQRAKEGARADQLKYGKGLKEEKEINNVFMGRCWQLPFCRKFVREKCPIYHARRTCWRERVGCMCEEEVIRNAMENKAIPKDMVAAARYIPVNNKIPLEAKKERCRQCVIYNEHQKHKYKLVLPIVVLGFGGMYALLRQPLIAATNGMVGNLDTIFKNLTFKNDGKPGVASKLVDSPLPFAEILLVCILIVVLAYVLKLLEYMIFKLKI